MRRIRLRTMAAAGLSVAVALVCFPATTEAKCASPGIAATLPSGSTLPPNGVVYVFAHRSKRTALIETRQRGRWIDAKAAGIAVPVATGGELVAWRVTFAGEVDAMLRVGKGEGKKVYTYKVVAASSAKPAHAFVEATRDKHRWTCSHTDLIQIKLTGAAVAYRVKLGGKDFHLPPSIETVWDRPSSPTLHIGHANCFGETTLAGAGSGKAGPIESITAIEASGLEVPIPLPSPLPVRKK